MARWSTKYVNRLGDDAFLYVAPGGHKNPGDPKRTRPLAKRKLPVRSHTGRVNVPHLKAALSRIPVTDMPESAKVSARAKARRLLAREHVLREVDRQLLAPALRRR